MKRIDPIKYSLYISSLTCVKMAHMLPDTDMVDKLKFLLLENCSITAGMIEGDQFLKKDITDLIDVCHEMLQNMEEVDAIQE